ncbi:hypothetical protein Harman_38840 [Haloarcula mannanilytica]|uniref:Uncharacterized protein n=1 Tax=Haloarcula mannanilytica TaxID=2509225 RepID=A0A4C2EUS9_9EURY|nr:hypothetical protein [Haloarcula mannanilytica]GCF15949.1 hypothetical protein Harman_38840 [Haloarcula mannanilytica]
MSDHSWNSVNRRKVLKTTAVSLGGISAFTGITTADNDSEPARTIELQIPDTENSSTNMDTSAAKDLTSSNPSVKEVDTAVVKSSAIDTVRVDLYNDEKIEVGVTGPRSKEADSSAMIVRVDAQDSKGHYNPDSAIIELKNPNNNGKKPNTTQVGGGSSEVETPSGGTTISKSDSEDSDDGTDYTSNYGGGIIVSGNTSEGSWFDDWCRHAQTVEWEESNGEVDWARYNKCWKTESYGSGSWDVKEHRWRDRNFSGDDYYAGSTSTFEKFESGGEWTYTLRSSMTCKPNGENDWWGWGRCYDSDRPEFRFDMKTDYGPPCDSW